MEQTALEFLVSHLIEYGFDLSLHKIEIEQAKEMEKQQKGYSEEEVELITNEMVNWAIDNVGNPFPQSGKKFDEVLAKYKKK